MELPIGILSKGAVIWIDFVYEGDPSKSKRRPAIVIDFDQESTRVVVLKVTSKGIRTSYDYQLVNPEIVGLKNGSVVRCNHIMTVPNNFKCNSNGNLSRRDGMAVEYLYRQAIMNSELEQA